MSKKVLYFFLTSIILFFSLEVFAVEVTLFGPNQYVRGNGSPVTVTDSFPGMQGQAKMEIINGDNAGKNRVSSATIVVNGLTVVTPDKFNQQVSSFEVPISVQAQNTISVTLTSKPGSYITINVIRETDLMEGSISPPIEMPETFQMPYTTEDGTVIEIEAIKGRVIILFNPTVSLSTAENLILNNGGMIVSKIPSIKYYLVDVTPGTEMDFINSMRQNTIVLCVQPDVPLISLQTYPNEWELVSKDPDFSWHLKEINAPLAWEAVKDLILITKSIGIIDWDFRALDKAIADFEGRIVIGPTVPVTRPDNYHGTKVTAIAAAKGNDGFGNVGVSWQSLINLEVVATYFDIPYQVLEQVNQLSDVISISMGVDKCSFMMTYYL